MTDQLVRTKQITQKTKKSIHFHKVTRLMRVSFWLLGIQTLAYQCFDLAGLHSISEEASGLCIILGMTALCYASWKLYTDHNTGRNIPHYYKVLLLLLLLWGILTILRSFSLNFNDLRLLLAQRILGWNWLVPVALIIGTELSLWQRILPIMVLHVQLGVILSIFGYIISGVVNLFSLTYAAPFLLLFYYKLPKSAKFFSLAAVLIDIFHFIRIDNRTLLVSYLALILCSITIHTLRSHRYKLRIRIIFITMISAVFLFGYLYSESNILSVTTSGDSYNISKYSTHLTDTTSRTNLVSGFFNTTNTTQLLFGRGALGRYYWYTYRWQEGRDAIENGWLFMILKGGIVMVLLFSMIAIPAAISGIFFSKNWFARGCGFIVLERLLQLIPYGLPSATLPYVIFWMAIGVCCNKRIRNIPEKEFLKINLCAIRKIRIKF